MGKAQIIFAVFSKLAVFSMRIVKECKLWFLIAPLYMNKLKRSIDCNTRGVYQVFVQVKESLLLCGYAKAGEYVFVR